MKLRAGYVRLCATHIMFRAGQRVQVIDRYVKIRANYVRLCATHIIVNARRRAQAPYRLRQKF